MNIQAPVPALVLPDPFAGRAIDVNLLGKIRVASQIMIVPSWLTKLPRTFGSASGGSLKADQWRIVATLYAPLVLIREWPSANNAESVVWLKLTTDLMSAIYSCTSHTVSTESIKQYHRHILSYLTTLKAHYKKLRWVPNYHAALHITEMLEEYGPAYCHESSYFLLLWYHVPT